MAKTRRCLMDSSAFCYWLQGYFELGGENLSPQQVQIIKDHLALVFNKVTPSYYLATENVSQPQRFMPDLICSEIPPNMPIFKQLAYDPTGLIYFTPQISEANRVDTAKIIRVC